MPNSLGASFNADFSHILELCSAKDSIQPKIRNENVKFITLKPVQGRLIHKSRSQEISAIEGRNKNLILFRRVEWYLTALSMTITKLTHSSDKQLGPLQKG